MSGVLASSGLLCFFFALATLGLTAQLEVSRHRGSDRHRGRQTHLRRSMRVVPRDGRHRRHGSEPAARDLAARRGRQLAGRHHSKRHSGNRNAGLRFSLTDRTAWQTAAYVRSLGPHAAQPLPGDVTRGGALYDVGRLRRPAT